jgi:glycosyltransferase involved in cell wall biosynthesis
MSVPKFSIISIAKKESHFDRLKKALSTQNNRDFEFVPSTKGTIPEAWNDAISKAKGDFFIFIDSDAYPLNDNWLEEISNIIEKNVVMKGIEIRPTDMTMNNLVGDADIFREEKFNESYKICEDMEFSARMKKKGNKIKRIESFPVVHTPSVSIRKTLYRSILNGLYSIKLLYSYGYSNIDTINTQDFGGTRINPLVNRFRIIIENIVFLLGLVIGAVFYLPIFVKTYFSKR